MKNQKDNINIEEPIEKKPLKRLKTIKELEDIKYSKLLTAEKNKIIGRRVCFPEKWSEVNPTNIKLMQEYLIDCKARKLKATTLEQYENDLRIIFIYILDNKENKDIRQMTKKDWKDFLLWLTAIQEVSNSRANRLLSTVRNILNFLEDDEEYNYPVNVAARIRGLPKEPVREIVFLDDATILKLVNALIDLEDYQKALLVALFYDTGARKSEMAQVEKYSFLDPNKNVTNILIGKRGKKYRAFYHSLSKKCAKLYLNERGEDDCPNLFIQADGTPATADDLYNWIFGLRGLLYRLTGKQYLINCHSFRHSMIQNLSDGTHYLCREMKVKNLPLDKIKLIVNHSSVSITEMYKKPEGENELADLFGVDLSLEK